jgi:hypothetical protein
MSSVKFYWLLIGILGVWQMTQLLHGARGPWEILATMRAWLLGTLLRNVVSCFYCLSFWVSLPAAVGIGETWPERGLLWFGIAGAVALIERVTQAASTVDAVYFEDRPDATATVPIEPVKMGNLDVQLRQ